MKSLFVAMLEGVLLGGLVVLIVGGFLWFLRRKLGLD